MKKAKKIIVCLIGCLMLSGCGAQIPELNAEQEEIITQYAATTLLKYDANYESGLMSEEEMAALMREMITPTPMPTPTPTQAPESENVEEDSQDEMPEELIGEEEPVDNRTIAEFFGLEGIDISYAGYDIVDSYPESGTDDWYFAMDAVEGNQLLVLKFDVANTGTTETEVDILNMTPRFRAFINGGEQINASTTLLTDDLKTMKMVLQPGETVQEVIVIEISEAEVLELSAEDAVLELMIRLDEDSLRMKLVTE